MSFVGLELNMEEVGLVLSCIREASNTFVLHGDRQLYRPSDRYLSEKLVPKFTDRRFHVVSVTDPYGRILGFLDRSRYFSIK
jgi:CBS-domain-containing membrane protein